MADDVVLPGTGDTIAADDVGAKKYQIVKSAYGADGSVTQVDATNRFPVIATKPSVFKQVTSGGLTTSVTAYTAGDQVGSLFTITDAVRATGGTGTIVSAFLLDKADIIGAFDIVLFKQTVTLAADNAAFSVSDADMEQCIGVIPLSSAYDLGANRISQNVGCYHKIVCSANANLFAALVTRFGHAFFGATTDLWLSLIIEQD